MMLKRLPSKNQRSKGIRVKHVLQIGLLIGICFWLVYQVKHSRDKKKEFDESGPKISIRKESDDVSTGEAETLRLGRKDLPREGSTGNERPEDEEERRDDEEREEGEEEEEETKNEEPETDNEIEEGDRERRDEDDSEENGGELEDRAEIVDSSDDQDQDQDQDQDHDRSSDHEAREEHYKADDASSEVTHEGEEEEEEGTPDGTVDDDENSETVDENGSGELEPVDDDGTTMVSRVKKVRHSSLSTKQPNEQGQQQQQQGTENNLIQVITESSKSIETLDSPKLNVTEESVSDPGHARNVTNDSESTKVELNTTLSTETDDKHEELSKDGGSIEKVVEPKETVQTGEKEGSSEKPDIKGDLNEKSKETEDPIQHDPIDSTDTQIGQEMNEARTDLETLPDSTTSLGNNDNEGIAAE